MNMLRIPRPRRPLPFEMADELRETEAFNELHYLLVPLTCPGIVIDTYAEGTLVRRDSAATLWPNFSREGKLPDTYDPRVPGDIRNGETERLRLKRLLVSAVVGSVAMDEIPDKVRTQQERFDRSNASWEDGIAALCTNYQAPLGVCELVQVIEGEADGARIALLRYPVYADPQVVLERFRVAAQRAF